MASGGGGEEEINCSICLDIVAKDSREVSFASLGCGHLFHLVCIFNDFNTRRAMQCPNCRWIENDQWLPGRNSDNAGEAPGACSQQGNHGAARGPAGNRDDSVASDRREIPPGRRQRNFPGGQFNNPQLRNQGRSRTSHPPRPRIHGSYDQNHANLSLPADQIHYNYHGWWPTVPVVAHFNWYPPHPHPQWVVPYYFMDWDGSYYRVDQDGSFHRIS